MSAGRSLVLSGPCPGSRLPATTPASSLSTAGQGEVMEALSLGSKFKRVPNTQ